jgi:hypothetical protein
MRYTIHIHTPHSLEGCAGCGPIEQRHELFSFFSKMFEAVVVTAKLEGKFDFGVKEGVNAARRACTSPL